MAGSLFLLQETCVVPSRQRAEIGTRLLEHLFAELERNDGLEQVYLLTDAAGDAESFYRVRGFHHSERKIVLSRGLGTARRSRPKDG